jgi:hypothetical protein
VPRRALHLAGLSLRDFLQPLFPEPFLEVFQAMAGFDPDETSSTGAWISIAHSSSGCVRTIADIRGPTDLLGDFLC